jgi:hypothetical protein
LIITHPTGPPLVTVTGPLGPAAERNPARSPPAATPAAAVQSCARRPDRLRLDLGFRFRPNLAPILTTSSRGRRRHVSAGKVKRRAKQLAKYYLHRVASRMLRVMRQSDTDILRVAQPRAWRRTLTTDGPLGVSGMSEVLRAALVLYGKVQMLTIEMTASQMTGIKLTSCKMISSYGIVKVSSATLWGLG